MSLQTVLSLLFFHSCAVMMYIILLISPLAEMVWVVCAPLAVGEGCALQPHQN